MSHEDLFFDLLQKAGSYEVSEPPIAADLDDDEPTVMVETVESDERSRVEREKTSSVTVVNLFRHPESHPIVLDLALLRKYSLDWLSWEIETLEQHIIEDFRSPTVSDLNMEKVQACKTLHLVDTFWKQWEVFVPCVMAFSGMFPDFEVLTVPNVAQCLLAVDIANRIREDVPWSDEVKLFLGAVHRWDDILCTQPPLEFVQIDTEGLPLDCRLVAELWPEARRTGQVPRSGTIEGEQIRRMLAAREYLEWSRAQLRAQLPVIRHV